MKSKGLRFLLIASLLLNLSFLATAGYLYYTQSGYWLSPFGFKIQKNRFLFEEISLQPEQLNTMKEKAISFRAETDSIRREIAQRRKDLISLIRADSPDTKAIEATIAEISGMQKEMQRKLVIHILGSKTILDREQQEKFFDLIENAVERGRYLGCPPVEQN